MKCIVYCSHGLAHFGVNGSVIVLMLSCVNQLSVWWLSTISVIRYVILENFSHYCKFDFTFV